MKKSNFLEGQITLFDFDYQYETAIRKFEVSMEEEGFVRDRDCTIDTPVKYGVQQEIIYGKGIPVYPRVDGRKDTPHFEKIHLEHLLPFEEYDLFVVLFSGGKDSLAAYLKLIEMGVPKEKIELWHHDIDGGHPDRRMDWPCTSNYVRAFADAEDVTLRISYRVDGFFGEMYRWGASKPIEWIDPDTGEVKRCKPSRKYLECEELKKQLAQEESEELEALIREYGYRYKFPAKAASLQSRWCSSQLKISVADSVISTLDALEELGGKRGKFPAKGTTHQGRWCSGSLKAAVMDSVTANLTETQERKILVISGERRGESAGRSHYNEIEIHRTNAEYRRKRIVHQWRPVIDWSEKDVWEIISRAKIQPHPCYRAGWNRCSCMMCVFSSPRHFKGIKELFPSDYAMLRNDEEILGFTLDNKYNLDEFIDGAESCVSYEDVDAIRALQTGEYSKEDIYVKGEWKYPCGAFHGADGGSC